MKPGRRVTPPAQSKMIAPMDMDFHTGARDEEEVDDPPPKNALERFWRYVARSLARVFGPCG